MRLIDADKLIRALKRLGGGARRLEGRFEDLGEVSDAIYEVGKQPTAYEFRWGVGAAERRKTFGI